jgi:hypothetical protein
MSLEAEYRELKAREQEITAREQRRTTMMITGASLFFTAQFGISYYTIFEVDWLGWDLVEPCTYSVTQGMSIAGLWFLYRNRFAGLEYSELSDYLRQKRQKKWLHKYHFDLSRLYFLQSRLEELEVEIAGYEKDRFV